MGNRHLTFEAAKIKREANRHLEGCVYTTKEGTTETVESIVIAPKNASGQFSFFDYYLETKQSNALLGFCSYHDYELVAVIQRAQSDGNISYDYCSLDKLLQQQTTLQ